MRRFWVWLWLAVLVGQLTSLWAIKRFASPAEPVVGDGEPRLLGLARDTAEAWEAYEVQLSGPPAGSDGDHSLLAREEWLLRLRDAEQLARDRGIGVRFAEELAAWMESLPSGQGEISGRNGLVSYLMDLDRWLTCMPGESGSVVARRLDLQPDSRSEFPGLRFELSGPPHEMASLLHEHCQLMLDWVVVELDLGRQLDEPDWWLRGSCVFRNRAPE